MQAEEKKKRKKRKRRGKRQRKRVGKRQRERKGVRKERNLLVALLNQCIFKSDGIDRFLVPFIWIFLSYSSSGALVATPQAKRPSSTCCTWLT